MSKSLRRGGGEEENLETGGQEVGRKRGEGRRHKGGSGTNKKLYPSSSSSPNAASTAHVIVASVGLLHVSGGWLHL